MVRQTARPLNECTASIMATTFSVGVSFLIDPSRSRMEERLPVPGPGWEVFPKRMEVDLVVSGEKGCMAADSRVRSNDLNSYGFQLLAEPQQRRPAGHQLNGQATLR